MVNASRYTIHGLFGLGTPGSSKPFFSSCLLGLIWLLFLGGGKSRKCGHDGLRGLLSGVKMTHGDLTQFIQYFLLQCSQEDTGDSRLLRCFPKKDMEESLYLYSRGLMENMFFARRLWNLVLLLCFCAVKYC